MSTRTLYYALGAIALVALLTLGARAAFGGLAPQAAPHSANLDIDSATRSYTAWAKHMEEQQNSQIDSATRSYMGWARHIEEQQAQHEAQLGEGYGALPKMSAEREYQLGERYAVLPDAASRYSAAQIQREYWLGERYGQTPEQFAQQKALREYQLGERYGVLP